MSLSGSSPGSGAGHCYNSGNQDIHARLLGSNGLEDNDLLRASTLGVSLILHAAFAGFRFWQTRFRIMVRIGLAYLLLGLALCIRAALANTRDWVEKRYAVLWTQGLLITGQLILIDVVVELSRSLMRVGNPNFGRSKFRIAIWFVLLISWILMVAAFANAPEPVNSYRPSDSYTNLRVVSAALAFFWVFWHALLVPFEWMKAFDLPRKEYFIVIAVAWFSIVPSLYNFTITVVTDDASPAVCSAIWFYVAFGIFPILPTLPFLILPLPSFGYTNQWYLPDLFGETAPRYDA